METWELAAREHVRDLIARYNRHGDQGRFDALLELFAPTAVMVVGDRVHSGRDEISTIFTRASESFRARPGFRYVHHHTSTHTIDVDSPDEARATCYYAVIMADGLDHWGRYIDRFTCIDGRWYFTYRKVTMDGRAGS